MRFARLSQFFAATICLALTVLGAPAQAAGTRVSVTGEVIDSWCAVTGIMLGYGTAHYQCAVWCAIGGIPVSIQGNDGKIYMIVRLEDDADTLTNPRIARFQTHEVTVDGDLVARDGVNFLFISKVADDKGIINLNHAEHGIVPFGE